MPSSIERIKKYFLEFQQGLARCQDRENSNISADLKDSYNRLSRLRERYIHEKRQKELTPEQIKALDKVFENDVFIKGLCEVRQIGEHVVARRPEGIKVFTASNSPIYLDASCSAGAVFSDNAVVLKTTSNTLYEVNHLTDLEEAEQRIIKSLGKADSLKRDYR